MSQSVNASEDKNSDAAVTKSRSLVLLSMLGVNATIIYGCINLLSWYFTYHSVHVDRPIIPVLLMFAAAFVGYVAAVIAAKQIKQGWALIAVIVGFAVLFRAVMVFSYPIQEVDIYRYMWDGEVQTQGISPFKFPPLEVVLAVKEAENRNIDGEASIEQVVEEVIGSDAEVDKQELKELVALCLSDPSVKVVLNRVHYQELPTIYPPTSQLVFRVASMVSPSGAWTLEVEDSEAQQSAVEVAVNQRLFVMKAILVAFDLGVLILLIGMLSLCRMPVGLSVAYGWCPLVLKEVANGGHLDAIAVFLSVLAIFFLVCLVYRRATSVAVERHSSGQLAFALLSSLVLAAAVGAKLYPIVLAPLVFIGIARRCSWVTTGLATIVFVTASFLLVRPILPSRGVSEEDAKRAVAEQEVADAAEQLAAAEQQPVAKQLAAAQKLPAVQKMLAAGRAPQQNFEDDPSAGLTKFLKEWEMNDFLFMVTVENLKIDPPDKVNPNKLSIWFSFVPQGLRRLIVKPFSDKHEVRLEEVQQKFQMTQQRLSAAQQQLNGPDVVSGDELQLAEIKAGIYQKRGEVLWRQTNEANSDVFGTPFKITRGLTSFVFLLIALWFAWRAGAKANSGNGLATGRFYCEAAFLSLAWFWLLLPTLNPWYWLWALPFLPFMRNRAWYAVSGIVLFYYFRFWMEYHFTGVAVLGTPYQGVSFFDFVLTWIEFLPWFIWLAIEGALWFLLDRKEDRKARTENSEPMVEPAV